MSLIHFHLKSVIFDMDGVITNTMPDHFRAWHTIFHKWGMPVSHFEIYRREGQQGTQTLRELSVEHGRKFTPYETGKILREKEELFKKIVKTRFIPGARSFLKSLYKQGFRLALVTGTSRHEMRRILPDQIYELFTVVVTGSDVQRGKPHPEPFHTALKKLDLKPKDAIVFENAPFGITSAKRAGLRCIALETSLPRKHLKDADYVFGSFRDIKRRVRFHPSSPRKRGYAGLRRGLQT
jgi:beta-phosphoglucomutase